MASVDCESKKLALLKAECMDAVYEAVMRLELAFLGCKTDIHNDDPDSCMCFVTIRGSTLSTSDPILFCDAVQSASNIEIYPLKQGDIQIALGFSQA